MSRYKILKSVAHNWASSVLSLEYFDDRGYLVQYLVEAARERGTTELLFDPLHTALSPAGLATPRISKLLNYAASAFSQILESQGCSRDMVNAASLRIEYETLSPCPLVTEVSSSYSFNDPWKAPECVPYHATCTIYDDRAREHTASPTEWWRS